MSKKIVVKHNDLIEAIYKMTSAQNKLLVKLATEMRIEDEDFKVHTFRAQDLLRELGLGEGNHDDLKKAVQGLVYAPMIIPKEKSEMYATPVSVAEYYENGIVELSIDPKLKPYYLQLKNKFTAYEAKYYYVLSSTYAQRLYELLKQYESAGERTIEIAYLRELFVLGNKYKLYADFKRRIIEASVKQINENTDLKISYTEKKLGRKTNALVFKIKKKNPDQKIKTAPLESKHLFEIPNDDLLEVLKKEAKAQRSDAPGLIEDLKILITTDKVIITADDPMFIERLGTLKDFIEDFFDRAGKPVDYT